MFFVYPALGAELCLLLRICIIMLIMSFKIYFRQACPEAAYQTRILAKRFQIDGVFLAENTFPAKALSLKA